MPKSRWLVIALICSFAVMPKSSDAQQPDSVKDQADDFVHDVLRGVMGPDWNLFLHVGWANGDRFLLQQATTPGGGERSLQGSGGYNIGGGAGVDVLLRMGFRASYTFTSSDLVFRTDNGDGSHALDVDAVGTMKTHTAALEVMRYMLPTRAGINPYGTLGIQGTWWQLDENSPLVSSEGTTPFAIGPLFSLGVQFRAGDHWSGRLEAALSSGRNPFTGNTSFRAFSGSSIDEPSSVSHTDYRFAGVYHFGRPRTPAAATTTAGRS